MYGLLAQWRGSRFFTVIYGCADVRQAMKMQRAKCGRIAAPLPGQCAVAVKRKWARANSFW
jgi:hypothetical protein